MLRDYQQDVYDKLKKELLHSKRIICQMPCRSGKSYIMYEICKSALKKGSNVLILAHRNLLLDQHRSLIDLPNVKIMSRQTEVKHLGEHGKPNIILCDECVTGDTEILTNEGYKRIDSLTKKEKIAQYNDDGTITFVKPLEYIEKMYNGDMFDVEIAHNKHISMSPNHVQPLYYPSQKAIKEDYIKNINFNCRKKLIVSGKGQGYKDRLSAMDKIAILSQADGTLQRHFDDYNYWTIQLKKDRKINRFLEIMNEANIEWKQIKSSRDKTRFSYKTPINITKKLSTYFNLEDMSTNYCKEFIEETSLWDGYTYKTGQKYYSSKIKENVDFVAAVGIMGEFKTYQSIEKDDRSEKFNDIYRLYLKPNYIYSDCQKCKKYKYRFKGKIYCVKVPSQKIILRANGYAFVSGNCHLSAADTYKKIFDYYSDSVIIGFTATPCRLDGRPLGEIYQKIVKGPTVKYLIDYGAISKFDYYAPKVNIDMDNVKIGDGDYNQKDLEDVMLNSKIYGDIIENYEKLAKDKQAIAYCVSIKHAQKICDLFNEKGYEAKCIHSKIPKKEREQILSKFKEKKFKIIVSVDCISEGISLPSCEVCLMLRPTQSYALYVQQGMRALTPSPDKKAIIIDYVGNVYRHGMLDDEEEFSLTERKRCKNSSGEPEVLVRVCQKCLRTYAGTSPICPYCGANNGKTKKEIENEKKAELERIEKIEKKKRRMEVGMQDTFGGLVEIAKERGYAPGWILKQCSIKHIPVDWSMYNKFKREVMYK